MILDTVALVSGYLAFAIRLDPTITAFIPQAIDAEIAIQGWDGIVLSEQQKGYAAKLATKAMLPRIIGDFTRKMQTVKGGPAEAEYVDAVEALKLLQKELSDAVKQAAKNVDPQDAVEDVVLPAYPTTGMMKI
jgi:hypothetical protein